VDNMACDKVRSLPGAIGTVLQAALHSRHAQPL
jgi:hypothetical protein